MNKYKSLGFSLIELLIVVAIIGILAGIGYPSYRDYVIRAHRSDGQVALKQVALLMERYYSDNNTYPANMTTLGVPEDTYHEDYKLSIAACDDGPNAGNIARCFKLTAAPQGAQTQDTDCSPLTLDSRGIKGPSNDCWD